MVATTFSNILATAVLFPFLVSFLTFFMLKKKGRKPIAVFGVVADLTTPFLFFSVYIITRTIFDKDIYYLMTTIAIIITITIAVIERLKTKEFQIFRLLRRVWRLLFLVLTIAYTFLLIVGISLKVIDYMS